MDDVPDFSPSSLLSHSQVAPCRGARIRFCFCCSPHHLTRYYRYSGLNVHLVTCSPTTLSARAPSRTSDPTSPSRRTTSRAPTSVRAARATRRSATEATARRATRAWKREPGTRCRVFVWIPQHSASSAGAMVCHVTASRRRLLQVLVMYLFSLFVCLFFAL